MIVNFVFRPLLSALLITGLWVNIADARIVIKATTNYYSVHGKTGVRLYKSMLRRGPRVRGLKNVLALTQGRWKISHPSMKVRGKYCVADKVTVKLFITYTYPRWKGHKSASKKMQARWQKYYRALQAHEEKHGALYRQLTKKYEKELRRARGRVSRRCRNFGEKTMRRIDVLRKTYEAKHLAFDRREHRSTSKISKLERALFLSK